MPQDFDILGFDMAYDVALYETIEGAGILLQGSTHERFQQLFIQFLVGRLFYCSISTVLNGIFHYSISF